MDLVRKLYKRGSSYEITIPKTILWNLDLKKKHNVVFILDKNRWCIEINENKVRGKNKIVRSLYKRGHSYETTLPMPIAIGLEGSKDYSVVFKYDRRWLIEIREN